MKRINITRLATAAGVASVLAMSSLASAADKKADATSAATHVTDPATLKKFSNVRVINATPAQVAAASKTRAPADGMRAYVDESGKLRAPTAADHAAEAAAAKSAGPALRRAVAAPAALQLEAGDSPVPGFHAVQLDESHMVHSVARVNPDGSVTQICVDGHEHAVSALATPVSAKEGHSHDK